MRLVDDTHSIVAAGSPAVLISLDVSAAFDTIEHPTLLSRLESDFGITDTALKWIESFLTDRSQIVVTANSSSQVVNCHFGVPQGSVLGPLMFTLYISPIANIVDDHGASHSAYADDANVLSAFDPLSTNPSAAECATVAIKDWCSNNGLLLNANKSECMLIGTKVQLAKCQGVKAINIAGLAVERKSSITTLGVTIDCNLSMDLHVSALVSSCSYHLRAFRHLRPLLSDDMAEMVGRAITLSRLDYCNSLLVDASQFNLNRLQRVQNQCVRVIKRLHPSAHVSLARANLH